MKSKATILPKVRIVVTSSVGGGGFWAVSIPFFLDLHGGYRGVCFTTVHLCSSYISQDNVFLNDTTFSFVLDGYDWRQK